MALSALACKVSIAITVAANTYGVNANLIESIIRVESSGDPHMVGSVGEVGLMQIRPEFHDCASFDVLKNVMCGTRYLSYLRARKTREMGDAWFVSYNYGPNRNLVNPRKTEYYKKVTKTLNVVKRRKNGADKDSSNCINVHANGGVRPKSKGK